MRLELRQVIDLLFYLLVSFFDKFLQGFNGLFFFFFDGAYDILFKLINLSLSEVKLLLIDSEWMENKFRSLLTSLVI
jgi:hypothetical protein